MAATVHDQPSEVVAEEGEVHIDGPDGVAFSFTPEAAIETAERLFRAGVMAQGQRLDQAKRKR